MIVTDIDGTLIKDDHNALPPRVLAALEAARRKGVIVCAVTARGLYDAKRVLSVSGFTGLCAVSNGAALRDIQTGEIQYQRALDKQKLSTILSLCRESNARMHISTKEGYVLCNELSGARRPRPWDMSDWPEEDKPRHIVYDTVEETVERVGSGAELICIHSISGEPFGGDFYRSLLRAGELSITSSHPGGLDVMAGGVGKTRGLRLLCQAHGIAPEHVMACGDHNNDIDMIRLAGLGVCVANGQPGPRAAADYVCPPNTEEGVAEAIERFVL